MTDINTLVGKNGTAELDFTWNTIGSNQYAVSFLSPNFVYTPGADSDHSTYYYTELGEVTFTATSTLHDGEWPIEYYWDFGDGYFGYGSIVTHEYIVNNITQKIGLRLLTNKNRRIYTTHHLYFINPILFEPVGFNIAIEFGEPNIIVAP